MRSAGLFLIVLVAAAAWRPETSSQQQQKTDPSLNALVGRLESAALAGRAEDIKRARVELLRLVAAEPEGSRASLLRYTIAYSGWRLVFNPAVPEAEQVLMLEDAVQQLTAVLKVTPNDPEALALLGAVQGSRIAKTPEMGMTLGPVSDELIDRALQHAASNPRALAISGQSALNTPPEYGGSVSRAEALFRASLKAFDAEKAGAAWPNWGRFDAHVWLGQALAQKGDKAGARAQYEKALAIAPDSTWVKLSLLPAVR